MAKLSISKSWEETKDVLARDGRLLGAVALALFVLPGIILGVSIPDTPQGELPAAGPWIAIAVVAVLVSLVGQLAVIRLAIGPSTSVGEAIAHGARRLLPYVAAVLVWAGPFLVLGYVLRRAMLADPANPSAGAALGLIVLCIVVAFFAVRLVLSSAVASSESAGPVEILKRSWTATAGNWWRLFAFMLLFGIGAIALILAVQSVSGLVAQLLFGEVRPLSVGGLLVAVVTQIVSAALSVTFFVMLARIYTQARGADR